MFPILTWTDEENAERQAKLHALLDPIHDELKGISLSGEGPRISRLKIIARMLEVAPDTIIQRDRQRQKKRIFWSSFAAMFFVILFTCLGLWTWDRYYRVHVGYFADYVEYWGVPRGIFPLSVDQWKHRQEFYKIYTQDQKVIRLEHVNSAETPIPVATYEFKDRPMIAFYRLYEKDRLVQRDTLNRNGKVVMSYYYSGDKMQKVTFKSMASDKTESSTVLTNVTSLTNSMIDSSQEGARGEIGNMRLVRDSEGRVIEERFQKGNYDVPTTDEQGIAGFRYKLDEYGRVVEKIYLDQDGNPRPDKKGVACQKNRYDDKGNLVETQYFDANGNLTFNENGWIRRVSVLDNFGNITKTEFFDASENPLFLTNVYQYNDQGNRTEEAYFGKGGKLRLCSDGYAKIKWEYDKRGYKTETAYFSVDDKPCLHKDGYSIITKEYDDWGNVTEVRYFNIDGKPCLSKEGFARITRIFNQQGDKTEEAYWGADNKPCFCDEHYAKVTWQYDEHGNKIETAYFDIEGKPCLCDDGYAKIASKFDEQRNKIEEAYFGTDGQPCLDEDGCAKTTWKYDDQGNSVELAYFGIDDKPCLCVGGYAKVILEYDEEGTVTKKTFYDVQGEEVFLHVSVHEVLPGSNSEKWGLKNGDFLILYDGQPVDSSKSFIEKRSKETGEDAHELVVLRDNEFIAIQIHPGKLNCVLGTSPLSKDQQKRVLEKLKEVKNDSTPPEND